jgi:ABC-2 type transport system permease protein
MSEVASQRGPEGADDLRLTPFPRVERSATVGARRTVAIVYRVVLGQLVSTGRVVALLLLALTTTIAGIAIGASDTADLDDAAGMIANLGLGVVVPVVALVFGGAAIGDLREDKTLVYLWLRPIGRLPIVVGAALAALSLTVPVAVPPVVLGAALTAVGEGLTGATVVATVVAAVAYVGVFTLFGVVLRRYIVWGLAYVLIWEGFVALGGEGVAQFAIRKYTRSIIADLTGADLRLADFPAGLGVVVPLAVAVAALAVAAWRLAHHDVD